MKEAEEQFIKYTNAFKKYGQMIDLKINHTVRVKDLCIELAKSLNLSEEDIDLAAICGLLHDIGRFEQWKRYKAYTPNAIHSSIGVEVLKNNNFISKFTSKNHNTILKVVKYHNKYRVPNTLTERNKMFVNIVRDADKIDIMTLYVNKELNPDIENIPISEKVYNELLNKKLVKNTYVKSKIDSIGVVLGFVFDLNYKRSYEILKKNKYIDIIIDKQIKKVTNKELINQLKEMNKTINNYIEEMIKC